MSEIITNKNNLKNNLKNNFEKSLFNFINKKTTKKRIFPQEIPQEISSGLYLQMLIFISLFLYPIWLFLIWNDIQWKLTEIGLENVWYHKYFLKAFVTVFTAFEPIRIGLGYSGNLQEKVILLVDVFYCCFY